MALPSSGTIWISQIRDEFGNWGPPNYLSHYYRGNLTTENNTGVPTSGYISLAHFYGTKKVQPGSVDYTSPGTYTFVVPNYNTLRRRVWGAGGSGSATWSYTSYDGANGGSSSCGTVSAGGGQGGRRSNPNGNIFGAGGVGGSGMTANGGNGGAGYSWTGGSGGSSPFGGAGTPGTSGQGAWSQPGGFPGGGSGGVIGYGVWGGGGGGGGGYSDVTVTVGSPGAPVPGEVLTVVVGAGGGPVSGGSEQSGQGGHGRVIIDWS